jgi:integrase/recombinase XerD
MNELQLKENYENLLSNLEAKKLLQNELLDKEVWHTVNDLGLKLLEHRKNYIFNFQPICPIWLNLLAKLYVLTKHKLIACNTLNAHIYSIKKFSDFLRISNSIYYPEQINNQTFEDFDYYLHSKSLADGTISAYYIHLASFFDTCRQEGWLNINTYWFQGRKSRSRYSSNEIDYIPEEVWNQLEENLHLLPEQLQRMVLIIRTIGLRIGELLNLPYDCLRQRNQQWRIRLKETEKYHIEDELPIDVPELISVIQEQQSYIKNQFNNEYDKLFCSNTNRVVQKDAGWEFFECVPKVMNAETFNKWLNRLALKVNICDKSGDKWHFRSHQFRRTVATVMTNVGIRDLIIQKYLRHRSPDMLNYYKHILQQVLREEYEELVKVHKYVDITGKVVDSHKNKNPVTEFLRRKMYQITTQYGECHRPTLKNPCPTVNSCWRCKEWRVSIEDLPYLKEDRKRVEAELNIAEKLGMLRQIQGLSTDYENLNRCIKGLEESSDGD